MELFDNRPEWQKKQHGQAVAAITHGECIRQAREVAKEHCLAHGVVTIDSVREGLLKRGFDLSGAVNWLGSTFKSKDWECIGFENASHPNSHGRIIRKWRLR
jgi:hypothetical protein